MNWPRPEGLLIIGYGNPLRGDDGAGPAAARRMAPQGFDARDLHQLTPELAEPIAAARAVIFLDADAQVAPGEVTVEAVGDAAAGLVRPGFDHYATPEALLGIARLAFGTAPPAWRVRIGGENFELREGLSEAAERAVARAVELLRTGLPIVGQF